MRLIDTKKMRKPTKGMFIYQDEFEDDVQHIALGAYTKDDIDREPTVEAIPIEWLKENAQEYFTKDEIGHLDTMITDWLIVWREENGS